MVMDGIKALFGSLLTIRDWVITVPDMGFVRAPRARGVYIGMLM
jgi:hypothetical protein